MTSQTKTYVELNDIVAIHCTCKRCGGSISLPLNADEFRTDGLYNCPNCKEDWTVFGQAGWSHQAFDNEIRQFVSTFKMLSQTIRKVFEARGERGLTFSLEVRNTKEASESVSRAGV